MKPKHCMFCGGRVKADDEFVWLTYSRSSGDFDRLTTYRCKDCRREAFVTRNQGLAP